MADLTTAVPPPGQPRCRRSPADRLLDVQAPQRPLNAPTFTIEVDGRQVTGREGQTILEVCRDNGIEIPTLCYEPKLPGFGACRMCVVEVDGEDQPPISCSRACEPAMVVRTQTPRIRQIRKTNLELIFSDHNAYCLPPCQNKCPSHIDIPGFLKANTEGDFRESTRIFKRTIPFPSVLGRVCPAPCEEHCRRDEVDEAIAIRDSHRYAGDQVLKAQAKGTPAPVPFEVQARSGKRVAVIGSGPAGASAAYYLAIAGHEVTVYERDPAPGGMLRYGIPQYRLPKDEVLDAGVRGPDRPRREDRLRRRARAATSPSTTSRTRASMRSAWPSAATTPTSWASPARTPRASSTASSICEIATLGLPYPGHAGTRVVVIGGGFTSMDCTRTSVRQGAKEVTLVYRRDMKDMPAANEVHEAIEEGARAIFQAAPTRVVTDEHEPRHRASSSSAWRMGAPDASGRRRPEPVAGHRVRHRLRPRPAGHRPGPRAGLAVDAARTGVAATKSTRLAADAVTFATGRPGVFGTGRRARRRGHGGARRWPRVGARRTPSTPTSRAMDLEAIRTRQTLAEPQPEFLSIVPYTGEVKEPRYPAQGDAGRGAQPELRRVRDPLHASRRRWRSPSAACSAPARRSATATCAARASSTGRRSRRSSRRAPDCRFRSVTENRFTGYNHDYIRDDSHAFILREPSRCIDCGRCANVCKEVVGAACYDFMRTGFDTLVTTPLDMSLNTTPCVSCGRCAETCPTGALMPKPRVLEKYEVDESRCILCGICVDACPYDALRCGPDFELAHDSREEPMIDLHRHQRHRTATRR